MALIKIGEMWYSDFRIGEKRIRRALSKYKPEANRLLKEMIEVRRAQRHGEVANDMSWTHFRGLWLDMTKAERDINTFYANRRALDMVDETTLINHLKQMSPDRLGRIKTAWMNSKKYSPATISRSIQSLLAAMRWAEDLKYAAFQNWRTVKAKPTAPRTDFYTREAYLELLSRLDGDMFTAALVMGRAGLRLGEMLHLEWTDINFTSWRISFRSKPQLTSLENPEGWYIKRDRNLNKLRSVPMLTPDLRQHLLAIKQPSGYVLGPTVSRLEHGFSRQLSHALKDTGIKTQAGVLGFPHILRHTFGSHLAQIGVPLQKIQAWMGHESGRMTERYSHLCPTDTHLEIQAFEKLCSGFVPHSNSIPSDKVLLGTLDPSSAHAELSSETRKNT